MLKYIFKRILLMVPILLVTSFIMFSGMHLASGDYVSTIEADQMTKEDYEELRESYGLNESLPECFQPDLLPSWKMQPPAAAKNTLLSVYHASPTLPSGVVAKKSLRQPLFRGHKKALPHCWERAFVNRLYSQSRIRRAPELPSRQRRRGERRS